MRPVITMPGTHKAISAIIFQANNQSHTCQEPTQRSIKENNQPPAFPFEFLCLIASFTKNIFFHGRLLTETNNCRNSPYKSNSDKHAYGMSAARFRIGNGARS
jgi:hypothetical protein